jgi:Zn-dependent membrane protease YugP
MYLGYGFYIIMLIPALILALVTESKVNVTFNKYSNVKSNSGITSQGAAEKILYSNGIENINICKISGNLTDNFDGYDTINLSEPVYGSASLSAICVAAHEAGHAVQKSEGYKFMSLRRIMYPVTEIGSAISMPLIVLSFMLPIQYAFVANIGILLYGSSFAFALATLPVEFNASHRALSYMDELGILSSDELKKAKSILFSAAMTYVSATVTSFVSFLRILFIFGKD